MSREQRERELYHSKYKDRNPYTAKTGNTSSKQDRAITSRDARVFREYEMFDDYDESESRQ
jgi:hypothetical protein